MDKPIIITPSELFTMFIGACTAIITISAAAGIIFKLMTKVKQPEAIQNERLSACENNIAEIYKKFIDYDMYFKHDKLRIDRLEDGNEAANGALLALLSHAINGNDIEALKEARSDLEKHLIKRKNLKLDAL